MPLNALTLGKPMPVRLVASGDDQVRRRQGPGILESAEGGRGGALQAGKAKAAAWIGQTLLLVASSVHRLTNSIDAYSLTSFRLAALAWMGLVAVGLRPRRLAPGRRPTASARAG